MGKKGIWAKMCGHNTGESCHNCSNKINIVEEKSDIVVSCKLEYGERTLRFRRKINPIPYCGAYKSSAKS